jgi:hypothetical protein
MENNPYDTSLEGLPREYQSEFPADYELPARNEGLGHPQRYSRHIDYPTMAPYQQSRQAQAGQQQTYAGYSPSQAARPLYPTRQQQTGSSRQGSSPGSQKMSKAEALNLLDSLKKTIMVGAIIGFGVLSALVATHPVGSAANGSQSTPGFTTPGGNPNSPDNNNSSNNPSNNGGYFNQQGGGNGFGSGGYSRPSSGTGVS